MSSEIRNDESKSSHNPEEQREVAPKEEGEVEAVKSSTPLEVEKQQEAQLRSKYPGIKGPASSTFLAKRLSKGQNKFFDSGDYNMAKAKVGPGGKPLVLAPGQKLVLPCPTGDAIPTPETVPQRKLSIHQSKLAGQS